MAFYGSPNYSCTYYVGCYAGITLHLVQYRWYFGALHSEAVAIWDATEGFNAAGWAGLSSWELFDHVTLRAGSLVVAAIIISPLIQVLIKGEKGQRSRVDSHGFARE